MRIKLILINFLMLVIFFQAISGNILSVEASNSGNYQIYGDYSYLYFDLKIEEANYSDIDEDNNADDIYIRSTVTYLNKIGENHIVQYDLYLVVITPSSEVLEYWGSCFFYKTDCILLIELYDTVNEPGWYEVYLVVEVTDIIDGYFVSVCDCDNCCFDPPEVGQGSITP